MPDTVDRVGARVVVVGGGMAGLAAAYDLSAEPGLDVVVLDTSDVVGGKLRQATVAGLPVDVGAESVLAVRPELVDLVTQAGLADLLTTPSTTSSFVWSRGALHPLPSGTVMGIPGDPGAAAGILDDAEVARLADERPYAVPAGARDVAVGEYVAARLGDAVVDRLVEPLLGGVYAGNARRLSLRSATPQLWPVVESGGSLLEAAVRARAAGRATLAAGRTSTGGTSADRASVDWALVGRTSGGRTTAGSAFVGVRGGVGSLPRALADLLRARGVTIRTGTIARELRRGDDGRWVVLVGPTIAVEEIVADSVVLALPSAPTARLLRPHARDAAEALAGVETASMAIVTLAVDAAALGELPGSGFLVPPVEGWTIKASTFSSTKWGWLEAAGGGTAYLRASIGRAGEAAVLQRPDAELVEVAVAEIGRAIGRPLPPILDRHVQRWGGALPQYAVGHADRIDVVRASVARLPGVEVAGATYEGVGIPAVVRTGRAAAAATLDHLTQAAR